MIRAEGMWLEGAAVLLLLGTMTVTLAACAGKGSDTLEAIRAALPEAVAGFSRGEPAEVYDQESIYSYIDGHAEVYLAYGMRRCLAQRYEQAPGGAGVVVDVFELATPADAYGVFTHDQEGEPASIGNDSLMRHGWLSFWKGPFFVSVYAEEEDPESAAAVEQLGQTVAAAIPEAGERPAVVDALPSEGRQERSVRFLHDQQILNTVLFISDENLFQLGGETDAALARYRRDGEDGYLLLVDYPDPGRRGQAEEQVERHLLAGSEGAPVRLEDGGWYACRGQGRRLAAVLDADGEGLAGALLADATGGGSR